MAEFGLNQYTQLSGIQNNTQSFFSCQDDYCESKESYKNKKKKKKKQSKFSVIGELELALFNESEKKNEEDEENKAINAQSNHLTHKAADVVGSTATKLAGQTAAKLAVGRKTGLFGNFRTKLARRKYAKDFSKKYGSSINGVAHVGADYVHDKYLKV